MAGGPLTFRIGDIAARFAPSVVFGVYTLAFAGWVIWGGGGERGRTVVSDVAFLPAGFLASFYAWRAARTTGTEDGPGRGWRLIALALLSWALGDLVWFYFEVISDQAPFPSAADVFYLGFYPLVLAGLVAVTPPQTRSSRLRVALDALTVTVVGALIPWLVAIRPTLRESDAGVLETVLNVAYPVGDVLMIFGAAVILLRRPSEATRTALSVLMVGAFAFVAADLEYARLSLSDAYQGGDVPDALWMVALWLFLLAAQFAAAGREDDHAAARQVALVQVNAIPYGAVIAGFGILLYSARRESGELIVVLGAACVIALLVSARQLLALRDNARLTRDLERLSVLEERDRIARELHDGVVQALFAVGLSLQAAEDVADLPAEARERLGDGVVAIDRSIADLRSYIFGLHEDDAAPTDIEVALRQLADIYRSSTPMHIDLHFDQAATRRFAPMGADILQVAREALSNAVRHSGGTHIHLTLASYLNDTCIEVTDDGCGFDTALGRRGHGLANLEARASSLGAKLEVVTNPGAGTTVRLRVPSPGA